MNLGVSRDSAVGRSVATFVQALVTFLVGLYAVPGVRDYVTANKPQVGLILAFLAALGSFINNFFRKDVPTV